MISNKEDNTFHTAVHLQSTESLKSFTLLPIYYIEFINENEFNFKIKANQFQNEISFFCYFTKSDYLNMPQKDFIQKVNNFKLLLDIIKKAFEEKKVIICRKYSTFIFSLYYPIFEELKMVFELHPYKTNIEEGKILKGIIYKNANLKIDTDSIDQIKRENKKKEEEIEKKNKVFVYYPQKSSNIVNEKPKNNNTLNYNMIKTGKEEVEKNKEDKLKNNNQNIKAIPSVQPIKTSQPISFIAPVQNVPVPTQSHNPKKLNAIQLRIAQLNQIEKEKKVKEELKKKMGNNWKKKFI